jgi:hypothetical protein
MRGGQADDFDVQMIMAGVTLKMVKTKGYRTLDSGF